jgi:hypothetical protein
MVAFPGEFEMRKKELIDTGDWASKHGTLVRVEFGSVYEMKSKRKKTVRNSELRPPRYRNSGIENVIKQDYLDHVSPNSLN